MKTLTHAPLSAVFQTEVLFNIKRIAPYALMILFSGNAVLWWAGGPAISSGWATNSDFYIVRLYWGFSFMTLPLFTALIMADPVIRDFRTRIDPLIFSKPINRAQYLLGKFLGNFFVLVCCQAVFLITLLLLQGFTVSGMMVLPARAFPYFKHFFIFVVISNLALAAFCFTVGTLTRNVKIVYGLVLSFYVFYIAWQQVLKNFSTHWRIAFDPLISYWAGEVSKGRSPDWLNQLVITYDSTLIVNRISMLIISALFLTALYVRFSRIEQSVKAQVNNQTSIFNLAPKVERLYDETEYTSTVRLATVEETISRPEIAIPQVNITNEGFSASLKQFIAASSMEFRLLRDERSFVAIMPLAVLICVLEMAYYKVLPDISYSAAYASRTTQSLMLFLFGITVFYTTEAMHRDRELRVEPLLWSAPAPGFVILLSKLVATILISISLLTAVALTAIVLQIYNGHAPIEIWSYMTIYMVVLIPSIVFMASASVALNVLLRDKYFAYAVSLAMGGGLFYLFSSGYNHWLYNPVLYQLWTPSDLIGEGANQQRIFIHRIYFLAIAVLLIALAHIFFERKSTRDLFVDGRLSSKGWALSIATISLTIAVIAGFIIA